MMIEKKIILDDADLQEIFALFDSVAKWEIRELYDHGSDYYFRKIDLSEEYSYSIDKREYSLDAIRFS